MNAVNPALGAPHIDMRTAASTLATPLRLTVLALLALIVYYFVGYDQGAVSVFGSDTHVHEFVHDARHLLGFPCH
ncbi:CbtB-domain containing protein [Mycolicibacterium cosmeticum]|uniref:Cobalt transporter subunit (CbtB) n=1 Tax=Mycolicibacterium cosmeticum TaxID=258533 RepID=W9B8W3_MYCCO|nr:CbtB domain-containing protein [Mycolicibacterium cosmeticum]TLH74131.1 CbtB-domain containing protein [Mycolicibacterium cosmeticum]CDO11081.1 putative cobalt transporter subunit (CbtB) [Mycolicibacterium cosmeticum]